MFEMGAKFESAWESENKKRKPAQSSGEILPPEKHHLRFSREKRRGKVVTLCGPFSLDKKEGKNLLAALKKELGTGGTFRGENLELQGECADALRKALGKRGFRFR